MNKKIQKHRSSQKRARRNLEVEHFWIKPNKLVRHKLKIVYPEMLGNR